MRPPRLRLFHGSGGARIAWREAGTGPPLVLLHAAGLSHREWEPVVATLSDRYRVVIPDLPLHGDSEDGPRHPYTPEWFVELLCAFLADAAGPRPFVAGHGVGAELVLQATLAGSLTPARLVLMPTRLGGRLLSPPAAIACRCVARTGSLPGLDRALSHPGALVARRTLRRRLGASDDLARHALEHLAGNGNRTRAWARAMRHWPLGRRSDLPEALAGIECPALLLWSDGDPRYPLERAQEALEHLPDGMLRVLDGCGALPAHEDPVAVARELAAFCR